MTDPAIIAASYAAERNYSHNPDDVIDASDAVGAWGTAKESTTKLVDLSGNGNIADIHGAMPTEGFIQGRRFTAANSNYLDCGNDSSLKNGFPISVSALVKYGGTGYEVFYTNDIEQDVYKGFWIELGSVAKINYGNGGAPGSDTRKTFTTDNTFSVGVYHYAVYTINGLNDMEIDIDGINQSGTYGGTGSSYEKGTSNAVIGGKDRSLARPIDFFNGSIAFVLDYNHALSAEKKCKDYNILARLPFWSVNYTDYPDNVTEYTDNLPYSSSIINSGTFKVDDDKLQCTATGIMTYSASYEFDGSEYIKVKIDGVEYAGTGTITQGNTTVSVAQGLNKITIAMGTADTIDKVRIQFREEV